MIAPRTTFGRLLRETRLHAGLTQEELSLRSGLGVRTVGDLERDRIARPHRRTVDALVGALDLRGAKAEAFRAVARPVREPRTGADETRSQPDRAESWGLPADLSDFVGREADLDRLLLWAERTTDLGSAPVLISGPPGVGKTCFAVHAGHRLAEHFPDGQVFVDLQGLGPRPRQPHETLGLLLTGLGVPEAELPTSVEHRTGLFRALSRDRALLVVLDNVADEAQIRPLLTGEGRARFVVTSRHTLAGLHAGQRIPLSRFKRGEALTLLGLISGWHRLVDQPDEATQVARFCGHLPLTLRIAGNRMAVRPQWAFGDLAWRLRNERTRLSRLVAGDLAIRPVLESSYRLLSRDAQRLFRRLALTSDGIASVPVAATLLESDPDRAEQTVEELVDASLLAPTSSPSRYRLEDPLRLLAEELLQVQERVTFVPRLLNRLVTTPEQSAVSSAPRSSSPWCPPSERYDG